MIFYKLTNRRFLFLKQCKEFCAEFHACDYSIFFSWCCSHKILNLLPSSLLFKTDVVLFKYDSLNTLEGVLKRTLKELNFKIEIIPLLHWSLWKCLNACQMCNLIAYNIKTTISFLCPAIDILDLSIKW